ncbi:PepSY-associated TM helix domain-containing protein [Pusillimonas noertemannii]|uniref:Putative iron-regulated membrane protein n=1 Tax=Pusillimonas noertemannii TaxID=305977 RepID=A0A2U1CNK5_9BURK|nr:PepSY-associated TM helix domain-containing protein [Pusillimonas noertemannii]NYT68396.1 PepSY domain-containing protein [Pusillimonas noertemannii]PVY62588.1 putative iron-regulated membrane protein [Pusillimonas noertemannii]TFL10465.1 PepSY domain-containing protein [Pusillimonas noertemannii]
MLSTGALRNWSFVHKWTSLISTVFLLMLCLTGLPLIFEHEIEHWLAEDAQHTTAASGLPMADLDQVVLAAQEQAPGKEVMFVGDITDDGFWYVNLADKVSGGGSRTTVTVDYYTGKVLGPSAQRSAFMAFMLQLHTDLFLGLPGKLFLGLMAFLLLAAIISGVVLYAPFMRRLRFGEIRRDRQPRLKWLDLHNLLGIVTLVWVGTVGATGMITTWAELIVGAWRADQMAEMVAPYAGRPPVTEPGSLQQAVRAAQQLEPNMQLGFVAYPGSSMASPHHYAVFMRGTEPLTSRLLKPVLVDARTLQVTDNRPLPWYMLTLLLSEPLHFGDYGGLPMKILWAALDIITIIVLGSGLYLWLARGRQAPAQPDRAIAPSSANRMSAKGENKRPHSGMRDIWQAPTIVAAITLVGLIAALVGDGWKDAVSWMALSVPVALIAWKWGRRQA